MEVKSASADSFVERPPKNLSSVLVYGPDEGLVRERTERLMRTVVDDLSDPFRVADLEGSDLEHDKARLFDEAAAISMLGGRRVVRVRGAGNGLAELFESYLEHHAGDALLVVEGGELGKSAALRRAFESNENAYAIPCYADSERNLGDVVRDSLKAAGLAIDPDALQFAVSHLGSDRGVTRQELEKLALYAHGKARMALSDVEAILGDETDARIEAVCDAAGSGDLASLDLALERLAREGTSPVTILWGAMAHFRRLLLLRSGFDRNQSLESAIKRLRPPVHFTREDTIKAQVKRWTQTATDEALELLFDAETLVKTTGVPAESVMARALFNVAAKVRQR